MTDDIKRIFTSLWSWKAANDFCRFVFIANSIGGSVCLCPVAVASTLMMRAVFDSSYIMCNVMVGTLANI